MARVVRWPQTLQVKATSIRRLGDLVKRDQGKVETVQSGDSRSAGMEGPSIPDPVVHPLPAAAFRTRPIAASYQEHTNQPNNQMKPESNEKEGEGLDDYLGERGNGGAVVEEGDEIGALGVGVEISFFPFIWTEKIIENQGLHRLKGKDKKESGRGGGEGVRLEAMGRKEGRLEKVRLGEKREMGEGEAGMAAEAAIDSMAVWLGDWGRGKETEISKRGLAFLPSLFFCF